MSHYKKSSSRNILNKVSVCMHEVGSRNKQSLKTWNRLNCPECPASSDSIFIRVTVLKHDFWLINICTASIILIRYFYTQIKPNTSLSLFPVLAYPSPKTRFLCLFRIENHQSAIRKTRPLDSLPGIWIWILFRHHCVRNLSLLHKANKPGVWVESSLVLC